ncbi:imelysin family protein [Parasedimentitalea psychrophila]|uniref:Imelysin family protein n=1 Tax=Parasedimentitalea psychrophila TaxID=2997337 RepID=A0A9Y2L1E4_9RHOB|nr:imelysin family protein [Parasedimentitalea psychrophila]WIY25612.1 imelysin family protein [Parasedimentitalea psychrophila]
MRAIVPALTLSLSLILSPLTARADMVDDILDQQILPGMMSLASTASQLAQVAQADCRAESPQLRQAFGATFDAWVSVSHLRFGPSEADNRAFALAFWPDSRGKIPKELAKIIAEGEPSIDQPSEFASYSIAARGLYALEFLLYDANLSTRGTPETRCRLTRAIAGDIASTARAIQTDWYDNYAAQMRRPGDRYQTRTEIKQELFKALNTGFQITADMRLGRPLGSFDRPRPNRAEARRSGRSLHHVELSLRALQPLALALSGDNQELAARFQTAFSQTLTATARLDDPTLAGVADPGSRFRIEALQQQVNDLRSLAETDLGPSLGVDPGFNSLDGD